ncbi:glycoside hydrolase superfamily [Suillus ampliporus]|nr:glycoside hydrolase superfamily [Suillus ampliporus]
MALSLLHRTPSSLLLPDCQPGFTANVNSFIHPSIKFALDVLIHEDGVVHVRMDEVDGLCKCYDEAARWALVQEPVLSHDVLWMVGKKNIKAVYGPKKDMELVFDFNLLKITLVQGGKEQIVLNDFLQVNPAAWFKGNTQDAWWDETFSSWTDTKPKGPKSLSLNITFPNHAHVYSIPERATNFSLPSTTGPNAKYKDPFCLYNSDMYEYLSDTSLSLYSTIPLMHAHSAQSTIANGIETHWISKSDILDMFLLPGPTPEDAFAQYANLTDDICGVQTWFDEGNFPVDAFWVDIGYAEDYKFFIWNKTTFPDPVEMIQDIEATDRRVVVIIEPPFKHADDYLVYTHASELGVLVKPNSSEGEYEGLCWAGSSSWIDFFHPGSWDFWILLFKTKSINRQWSWTESSDNVGIWNDMNEPSVLDGPEVTMLKDNIHYGGWEHRDVHKIYGMLFICGYNLLTWLCVLILAWANLSHQAAAACTDPPWCPFIITHTFWAGSQCFGAMWMGDNISTWEHMAVGIKMVLTNGVAGMLFSGSDIGRFFGDPEPEMLIWWYGVGAFSPFFRVYAGNEMKHREPYLLKELYQSLVWDILYLRYSMLPVWYNMFKEMSKNGMCSLRCVFMSFLWVGWGAW